MIVGSTSLLQLRTRGCQSLKCELKLLGKPTTELCPEARKEVTAVTDAAKAQSVIRNASATQSGS